MYASFSTFVSGYDSALTFEIDQDELLSNTDCTFFKDHSQSAVFWYLL